MTDNASCGILVVNRQARLRTLLGRALRRRGHAVWLAGDRDEAVAVYRRHRRAILLALIDEGAEGARTLRDCGMWTTPWATSLPRNADPGNVPDYPTGHRTRRRPGPTPTPEVGTSRDCTRSVLGATLLTALALVAV